MSINQLNTDTTYQFGYDPFGRRKSWTDGTSTKNYWYDNLNVLSDGASSFLNGTGIDEPLQLTNGSNVRSHLQDIRGSVSRLVNASSGSAVSQNFYTAYGKLENNASNPAPNPFTYTAREDDGNSLMYYRARYYDPKLEMFISQDPLGDAQRYTRGNPIGKIDPLGLTWRDNPGLFMDWLSNRGANERYYGPTDPSTLEIMQSKGVDLLRADSRRDCSEYVSNTESNLRQSSFSAFVESLNKPGNGTQVQVGGYQGSWSRGVNGVTYVINNQLSMRSFFYHLGIFGTPDRSKTPFMGNINQHFYWTEADYCQCK